MSVQSLTVPHIVIRCTADEATAAFQYATKQLRAAVLDGRVDREAYTRLMVDFEDRYMRADTNTAAWQVAQDMIKGLTELKAGPTC